MHKLSLQVSRRLLFTGASVRFRRWNETGRPAFVVRLCTRALVVLGLVIALWDLDSRKWPVGWSTLHMQPAKPMEGRSYNRRALTLLQNSFGTEAIAITDGLIDLAALYQRQKRYGEAESLYDRALIILMYHLGADSPRVVKTLHRLAELHQQQGNTAMVNAIAEFARSLSERAGG